MPKDEPKCRLRCVHSNSLRRVVVIYSLFPVEGPAVPVVNNRGRGPSPNGLALSDHHVG
jgi:hypothetical protein